jgi:hypothetical protein
MGLCRFPSNRLRDAELKFSASFARPNFTAQQPARTKMLPVPRNEPSGRV